MSAKRKEHPTHGRHKSSRKINKRNLWCLILVCAVLLEMIFGTIGLVTLGNMLQNKPTLNVDDFFSPESSHIYDKDGNQIADVGTQLRENITYDQLPESLVDAFVSVEDSRYFEHNGFDLPRFTKAMIENLKSMSFKQGGSTFTMQLVKMTYFQNDETGTTRVKSIEYKVQQIALAMELEKTSNKKAIFELYLNKLNFGGSGNIRGIQKAAEYYFGKTVSELNLAESAMLAGVINSPYYYDPHNYLDLATKRRDTVLNLMVRHGYITETECKLAKSIKVEDLLVNPSKQSGTGGSGYAYQSYIDTVINEAQQLTGDDPTTVAMDIYTSMDTSVQTVVDGLESTDQTDIAWPDDLMECGIATINNQTGEIVAIGGGRNYGRGGSMLLNHATDQYKQPGSSVKPFLDYALAFEYLGWATDHVVTDKPIVYTGTNVVIKNANNTYMGQIPLKKAVGLSLNTPAIQTLEDVVAKVGAETVDNYLMRLGFSQVTKDNFDIGFAIGGSNFTCSPLELAAAHAILMNGGNYIKPHTISKITYRSGAKEPVEPTYTADNVLSPQAAYLAAQLMYDAVNTNYYNYLQILIRDYAVYGKTGTTDWGTEGLQYNIPQGASKDKWMVSETSMYTTAVWVGYEKGIKDKETYFTTEKSHLNIPGIISSKVLSALTDDVKPAEVQRPDGISEITHILGTFPYASVIDGMDSAYITTGLIKSDAATLVDPQQAATVEQISTFSAAQNGDSIDYTWGAYPDASKLTVADSTMDLSLSVGDTYVEAYGARMFDYSWIYGPIRYKARVMQDGTQIADITSDTETHNEGISLNPGSTIQVCGYYAYESGTSASNEICTEFTAAGNKEEENKPTATLEATPTPAPTQTPTPAPTSVPDYNQYKDSESCKAAGGSWNDGESKCTAQ